MKTTLKVTALPAVTVAVVIPLITGAVLWIESGSAWAGPTVLAVVLAGLALAVYAHCKEERTWKR